MCQHRHFRMFKFMTPIESNYLSVSDQSKLLLFSGEKNKEKKKEKTKEREPIGTNFLSDLKMKSIVIGHYHYQTFDYWGLWGYNFYDFFFFLTCWVAICNTPTKISSTFLFFLNHFKKLKKRANWVPSN